jgi:hypothetical protein
MGLFGSTKTYVSSVLYNMAGDPLKRPNFLKTSVAGQVILGKTQTMGETLRENYLKGPALKLRSYFRWSLTNYDSIGVPKGTLGGGNNISRTVVAGQIPADPGKTVQVQLAETDTGDYSYWAEQFMFLNYPALINTAWTSDIAETTQVITITFADSSMVSFTPTNFDQTKAYLYAVYSQTTPAHSEAPVVGGVVTLATGDAFPDTTDYIVVSDTTVADTPNHHHIVVYQQTVYYGQDPDPTIDVTYSVKTTITEDTLLDPAEVVLSRTVQTTTQRLIQTSVGPARMFIYQVGSGNDTLDAEVFHQVDEGEYVPFIPIRLDNKFLDEIGDSSLLPLATKAYKKVTGGAKFSALQKSIHDNEHLADIDYAYVMYGASLNMLDNSGREYIYRFFEKCRRQQLGTSVDIAAAELERAAYRDQSNDFEDWTIQQSITGSSRFGATRPPIPGLGVRASNSIQVKSDGTSFVKTNLDMKITWDDISKVTGTGLAKYDAKKGDYWIVKGAVSTVDTSVTIFTGRGGSSVTFDRGGFSNTITIYHQIDAGHWEALQVVNAKHINNIYNNKSVDITASEGLDDSEESGFLVPLHYATLREMSLVAQTQLSISCGYVVLNCYKVVKTGFFGSFIFKILIFIVIIAITVIFPPAGGVAGGILGSAAGVGAALGLTGTLALIVGAALNALAAILLLKVISLGAVLIFGDKLGAIIGTIVGLIALQVGTAFANGQSFGDILHSLSRADNLIRITESVGNGFSQFIVAGANETIKKTQDLINDYTKKSKEVTDQYVKDFGYGTGTIDPLELTDAYKDFVLESAASFLDRTLLTGSDIAQMSMDIINNFADYTLDVKPGLS